MASKLGKGFSIKDGKVVRTAVYQNVSQHIKAKKSKKVRVVKRSNP